VYWCVTQTECQHEAIAQRHLERQGFEVYFPRIKVVRNVRHRHSSRLAARVEPLFRSYLFVRIDQQWSAVRWSIGVCSVLLDGGRPAPIGDQYIDDWRSREGADGLVRLPQARPQFVRGDKVHVAEGPLAGQFGIYQDMRPH
jgi:transcriptional antiterminator RfaH